MSTIIETILKVGQALFGLKGELANARDTRKGAVADFLAEIAGVLEEASALLQQGTYPHKKCEELLLHSQHMEAAIGDLVGVPRARELGVQLAEAHQIEQLHAELHALTAPEPQRRLSLLDTAAGHFRATAAFVRASP